MRQPRRTPWQLAIITLLILGAATLGFTAITAHLGTPERGKTWQGLYRLHSWIIPFGPDAWRAPYNAGTGALMSEDYDEAARHLQRAYALVPAETQRDVQHLVDSDECRVRMNYSLAIEGQGDHDANPDQARELYRTAAQISRPCTTESNGSGDTLNDRIHQRQHDLGQTNPQTPDPTPEPDPTTSPSPSAPAERLDDKQDQLEENQRQAEEQRREYDQRKERGFGHGDNW
ncbi:MAG: hypothetical protein Q4Q03_07365 [Bowdeniella nasicola]|nr:hypothetical protein [Bowdeniella nasicola]